MVNGFIVFNQPKRNHNLLEFDLYRKFSISQADSTKSNEPVRLFVKCSSWTEMISVSFAHWISTDPIISHFQSATSSLVVC